MLAFILYVFSSFYDGFQYAFAGKKEHDECKQEDNIVKLLDDINEFYSSQVDSREDYYSEKAFFYKDDELVSLIKQQSIVTPPHTCKHSIEPTKENDDAHSNCSQPATTEVLANDKNAVLDTFTKVNEYEEFDLQRRVKLKQKTKNNENFETFKILNEAKSNSTDTVIDNDDQKGFNVIKQIESFVFDSNGVKHPTVASASSETVVVNPKSEDVITNAEKVHSIISDSQKERFIENKEQVDSGDTVYVSRDYLKKMDESASSADKTFDFEKKPQEDEDLIKAIIQTIQSSPVTETKIDNIKTKQDENRSSNKDENKGLDDSVSSSEETLYLSSDDLKKMLKGYNETKRTVSEPVKEVPRVASTPLRQTKRLSFREERLLYALQRETSDTMDYRLGYPGLKDSPKLNDNLDFLMGKIKSRPNGDYIDNIHKDWWANYKMLSQQTGYIQWLFPIRIQGTNYDSHALQKHELETLKSKENVAKVQQTILKSFEMMLDFYGIQFISKETGKLQKANNYLERYDSLTRNVYHSLHITRIMKCLGEFEMDTYQIGFLEFMLDEIFVTKDLDALSDGLTRYWIHTVKDDAKRTELLNKAKELITK